MCLHLPTHPQVADLGHAVLLPKIIAGNRDLNSRRSLLGILWNASSGIIQTIKGGSLIRIAIDQSYKIVTTKTNISLKEEKNNA